MLDFEPSPPLSGLFSPKSGLHTFVLIGVSIAEKRSEMETHTSAFHKLPINSYRHYITISTQKNAIIIKLASLSLSFSRDKFCFYLVSLSEKFIVE
jgi:hypothetical protein